jgi:hypothetical protein
MKKMLGLLLLLAGCAPQLLGGRDNDQDKETEREALDAEFASWADDCEPGTELFGSDDCSDEQLDAIWDWLYCLTEEGCGARAACEGELDGVVFDDACMLSEAARNGPGR